MQTIDRNNQQQKEALRMHRRALALCKEQVKKHHLGKLAFLSFVGTRPWLGASTIDFDYRGIYMSREENSYRAFISTVWVNSNIKDIILISFERFLYELVTGQIQTYLHLNSPAIYSSKAFTAFIDWINGHPSKHIYKESQLHHQPHSRKDYLYNFLELGNIMVVLEGGKIITDLSGLNKKYLHFPVIEKLLAEELTPEEGRPPFVDQTICRRTRNGLVKRIQSAYKHSALPPETDIAALSKLNIVKKINLKFWFTS